MSSTLENAIQEKVRALSDEQQREVLAFLEELARGVRHKRVRSFSFIGIARSGKGSLSTQAETTLEQGVDRREGNT